VSTGPAPPPPPTTVFGGADPSPASPVDACPLCGAPLHPEQEWCLRCGAAARTRLATSANWKAPIIVIALVATLSIAVLTLALIKLAGGFNSTKTAVTIAVTPPATVAPPAGTTTPGAGAPSTTGPGAGATSGPTGTSPTPTGATGSRSLSPAAQAQLRELEVRLRAARSPTVRAQLRKLEERLQGAK
jgi:hypothetical protein